MAHCANTRCKWHDPSRPTGCTLFGGKSWTDCRTKTVRKDTPNPKKDTKQ